MSQRLSVQYYTHQYEYHEHIIHIVHIQCYYYPDRC